MNVGDVKKIELARSGDCVLVAVYEANYYSHRNHDLQATFCEDEGELDHVYMVGGRGNHSLRVDLSRKRILAHWRIFLNNNGQDPAVAVAPIKRSFHRKYYIDYCGIKRSPSYMARKYN